MTSALGLIALAALIAAYAYRRQSLALSEADLQALEAEQIADLATGPHRGVVWVALAREHPDPGAPWLWFAAWKVPGDGMEGLAATETLTGWEATEARAVAIAHSHIPAGDSARIEEG